MNQFDRKQPHVNPFKDRCPPLQKRINQRQPNPNRNPNGLKKLKNGNDLPLNKIRKLEPQLPNENPQLEPNDNMVKQLVPKQPNQLHRPHPLFRRKNQP